MAMADQLTFRLPMPLNLGNSRMHHMVKHKHKVAYWGNLDILVVGQILPKPPKKPWAKATVRSAMVLGAAMDMDNAMSRHKWCMDWLVKRKYLVDDKTKCLTWETFPTQTISRKNEPSITLTLTRVED